MIYFQYLSLCLLLASGFAQAAPEQVRDASGRLIYESKVKRDRRGNAVIEKRDASGRLISQETTNRNGSTTRDASGRLIETKKRNQR